MSGRGGRGAAGRRQAEYKLKTKNPHSDVGKNASLGCVVETHGAVCGGALSAAGPLRMPPPPTWQTGSAVFTRQRVLDYLALANQQPLLFARFCLKSSRRLL